MQKQDIEAAAVMYADIFKHPPWNEDWTPRKAIDRILGLGFRQPGAFAHVVLAGDQLIGLALGAVSSGADELEATIDDFGISPAYQRKGAGARLLQATLDYLASREVETVRLCTLKKPSLYRFYQRYGFKMVGLFSYAGAQHCEMELLLKARPPGQTPAAPRKS